MSVFRDIDLVETSIFNSIFLRGNVTLTYEDTPITSPNDYYFTYYGTPITTGSTTGSAATVYIDGAPSGTIGNSYSLYIAGGKTYIGGGLQIPTGAGDGYVLTSDASGNAIWAIPISGGISSFNDGTASLPSIYFTDDTGIDTGFYRISEDTIGITTGGTLRLSISNTGLTIADGLTTNIGTSGISSILNIYALTDIFGSTAFTGIGNDTITNATIYVAPSVTAVSSFNNYYFSYFDSPTTTGTTTGSAYTVYIAGSPTPTTGSISSSYSAYIESGKTYIGGSLQIPTGANNGYILTSDVSGNASWSSPPAIGSFTDGTSSLPSIYFSNDTDLNTGFYRISEDTIGITTGGALRLSISNTVIQSTTGITYNIGTSGTTSPLNVFGLITGNALTVTGNVNGLTHTITGSTSGVITLRGQAAAGTYNFNLPNSSGTAGQVLTSQGGGANAMTWTNAGTSTVTSVALSVPSFLSISGSPITTNGTLAIGLSGIALPVINGGTGSTTSTGTGSVVLANTPTLITPVLGVATGTSLSVSNDITSSTINLFGSISGNISIRTRTAAGTYGMTLPITSGDNGQVLTSAGGGTTAMYWINPASTYFHVSDITARSLSSSTLTDIPLITLTPIAGTYMATFIGTMILSNNGRILSIGFAKNGISVANSLSQVAYDNTPKSINIMAPITCNGTDVITVQWAVSSNSVSTPANSLRVFTLMAVI